ncbi:uncharacterized protein LOC135488661 [Lineus longissimus]|uniref:uncharacterized protein LOC135488661 n=1 Tax=Lineus longissimus TaxID=88925 RepID=UPI002B4D944F
MGSNSSTVFAKEDFVIPRKRNGICGQRTRRDALKYQYALFQTTMLTRRFNDGIHPHEIGDKFYNDYRKTLKMVQEKLKFNELQFRDFSTDSELDYKTKTALIKLAYSYILTAPNFKDELEGVTIEEATEMVPTEVFKFYYEGVLDIIMNDMERKECWEIKTAISSRSFRAYLKDMDPMGWSLLQIQYPNLRDAMQQSDKNRDASKYRTAQNTFGAQKQFKVARSIEQTEHYDPEEAKRAEIFRRSQPVIRTQIQELLECYLPYLDENIAEVIVDYMERRQMSQGEAENLVKTIVERCTRPGTNSAVDITMDSVLVILDW